ncbi:MAG: amino acid permease [Anaerolineae bacterium]
MASNDQVNPNSAARFGTFKGVFTPNILTILGIILFLRMGEIVGQAGLWNALIIIGIANAISLMTGFSLSSIATNMTVRAGGNYYIISRSLGLEIGGAIGIPLYLSQAISVAFYIIGFTEALMSLEMFAVIDARLISTVVTLIFVVIAYVGADFALRIQYIVLAILMAALVSFFAGGWNTLGSAELVTTALYSEGFSFWVIFALFFPAVTGIEVGTSLSGDLKDPSRSIPIGTIASIIFTTVIYFLVAIWLSLNLSRGQLVGNTFAMQEVAVFPLLILLGVWASTLSSALGSVLAAPRTLQAIANDRIVPYWVASRLGSPTEPRMAVLLTGVIAVIVIWAGDLNFVAPIITMFFLNTYGMVNLAAGLERVVQNPSFRPTFPVHWSIPLLGALGCYGAMFLINAPATVMAIVVSYGFYLTLKRREIERTWGDLRSGIWFAMARYALLRLSHVSLESKNWRPNIIVFTGQPHNRQQLTTVADWLTQGRGIVTFFQLIVGEISNPANPHLREVARKGIQDYIDETQMEAFSQAEVVSDFRSGVVMIVQAYGLSHLESNTVLFGWSRTPEGRVTQIGIMRDCLMLGKSVLFLNYNAKQGFGQQRTINLWWQGRGGNEDLMLLLAHIIQEDPSWKHAEVNLLRVVNNHAAVDDTRAHMQSVLDNARIHARPVVIVREDPAVDLTTVIRRYSDRIDLTIIGMHLPTPAEEVTYAERLNTLVESIGTVLIVRNAELDTDLLSS